MVNPRTIQWIQILVLNIVIMIFIFLCKVQILWAPRIYELISKSKFKVLFFPFYYTLDKKSDFYIYQ